MATNKAAIEVLKERGYSSSSVIVADLISAGILEADLPVLTPAEQLADVARRWCGAVNGPAMPGYTFDCAAGWSTAGWQWVIDNYSLDIKLDYPGTITHVFHALVILAKDAGRL